MLNASATYCNAQIQHQHPTPNNLTPTTAKRSAVIPVRNNSNYLYVEAVPVRGLAQLHWCYLQATSPHLNESQHHEKGASAHGCPNDRVRSLRAAWGETAVMDTIFSFTFGGPFRRWHPLERFVADCSSYGCLDIAASGIVDRVPSPPTQLHNTNFTTHSTPEGRECPLLASRDVARVAQVQQTARRFSF